MNAPFKLSGSFEVDASDGINELARLNTTLAGTQVQLKEARSASAAAAQALDKLKGSGTGSADAINGARAAFVAAQIAENELAAAARAAATALGNQQQAMGRVTASAGQARSSMINLGQQIGDVAQGYAAGINPAVIFAQQSGQVAAAMSGLGGAMSGVAKFLGGPWGIALTTGLVVLSPFIGKLFEGETAADKITSAFGSQKKAIEELDRATGFANKSAAEGIRLAEVGAKASAVEAAAKRDLARAALAKARADLAGARADQQEGGARGSNFGSGFVVDAAEGRFDQRKAELDTLEAEINASERRTAASISFGRASAAAKAATDASAAANQAFERTATEVKAAVDAGTISEAQATAQLTAAERVRAAAIDATKDAAKAQREQNKELRDAARDAKAFADQLETVRLAGVKAVAAAIAIGAGTSFAGLKEKDDAASAATRESSGVAGIVSRIEQGLPDAGARAAKAFRDGALADAAAIGQAIGGGAGRAFASLAVLGQGSTDRFGMTRDFTGFGAKLQSLFQPLTETFSDRGQRFAGKIGQAAGGAATGSVISGIGDALGIKNSKTGSAIGGAVGSFLPIPGGEIIGSILGGLAGNLFGPKGSTTISASGGKISSAGTGNAAVQKATGAIGNTVTDALQSIAEQLGGEIGDFSVSIGKKKGQFRVDRSGTGKLNGGTVTGTDDEGEALTLAIADALKDGAIKSSPRVQAALLAYADNVNKAVTEALKVKNLEDLLADRNNPFLGAFRALESQLKQRVDVARQYGFDLVEIEKVNAKDRAAALQDTLARATGSIRALLTDLTIGSGATGSATQRLAGLTSERDRLVGLANAGDTNQGDAIADIIRKIDDLSRETYGSTAGFASGRADNISILGDLMRQTEDRAKAAADQARGVAEAMVAQLGELNATGDDQFAVQVRMAASMASIDAQLASGALAGGGGFGLANLYARER